MKPDKYVDELIQPIVNIYNSMEVELLKNVAKRFVAYDEFSGSAEWLIKKLDDLGSLNAESVKIIAKYAKKSEAEIKKALEQAGLINLDTAELQEAFDNGIIEITPEKLLASEVLKETYLNSYDELGKRYKKIQTKALESIRGQYINVLNKAYLGVSSGTYSFDEVVRTAINEMAKQGLEGATYWRGNKVYHYSIEGVVRRDTLTAMHDTANKTLFETAKEANCTDVEISQHFGARIGKTKIANHAGWQGKVYRIEHNGIWAQELQGVTELEKETGYGQIEGFGGVNCRHRAFLFWKGFSTPKKPIDRQKSDKVFKAEQKQRRLEREIRSLKKQIEIAKTINDADRVQILNKKLNDKFTEINAFCADNGLKRDYTREIVYEQL